MGRQKASVQYTTCLIAQAVSNSNLDSQSLQDLLRKLDFFQSPDLLIRRQLPKLLQSPLNQLIRQSYDPTPIWDQYINKANQTFQLGLSKIAKILGIAKKRIPSVHITSYFAKARTWWGANYHREEQVVNILPPILLIPSLVKGLLFREVVRCLLPPSFQDALDAQEFANILAGHLLQRDQRKVWFQLRWGGTRLSSDQTKVLSTLHHLITQLNRKEKLPNLLQRLQALDLLTASILFDGLIFATKQVLEEKPPAGIFTKSQQQILLTLAHNPAMSERQLAEQTQLARGTITRNLAFLRKNFGLEFIGEINYPKIGLTPLLVTIKKNEQTPYTTLLNFITKLGTFPFCIRMDSPLIHLGDTYHIILALPNHIISDFSQMIDEWKEKTGLYSSIRKIIHFEWGWHFHWWNYFSSEEWQILSASQLRDVTSPLGLYTDIKYGGRPIRLTKEALRVLVALEENTRLSTRRLAQTAQISITTASSHRTRFIPSILKPTLALNNSTLNEVLEFTITCSSSIHLDKLARIFQILPAYQMWQLIPLSEAERKERSAQMMLITVALTKGGIGQISSVLQKVLHHQGALLSNLNISNSFIPRIHGVPFALFSPAGQQWVCPHNLIESLFTE